MMRVKKMVWVSGDYRTNVRLPTVSSCASSLAGGGVVGLSRR